jgi:putative spermidine/putrescine transport system permease protein
MSAPAAGPALRSPPRTWPRIVALLAPCFILYVGVYFSSSLMLFFTSLGLGNADGKSLGLWAYYDAFTAQGIGATLTRTLRVSLFTVLFCLLLGFPVSRYLATATGRMRGVVLMCVLSPLMVTAIGRIFGWVALFGPGSAIANLMSAFFDTRRTGLLYTETAMVIGLTNLLLPFMVLAIVGARVNVDESLLKAAYSLGAKPWAVLRQVEIPLTLPGIVSGVLIVFSLSISNFITAALLGGSGNNVVAYEIYLDTLIYFKPERGAALSILLLMAVGALLAASIVVAARGRPDERVGERT